MPETPEQLYERVAHALRMPPVDDWDTFPFDGVMHPRQLQPPVPNDPPREGEGGVGCEPCAAPDDDFLWTNERWRLRAAQPNGLPVVVLLETREHYAEPGDLPEGLASELGVLIARIERAVRSVGDVGRVHVCRWGDGSEHLHWWFMARPARIRSCSAASQRSGTTSFHPHPGTCGGRTSRRSFANSRGSAHRRRLGSSGRRLGVGVLEDLSPSGVTRAVDQLERRGLVERRVVEGDKRGHLATLTAEGRALLRRATSVHVQGLREHLLSHISRTELEGLVTALEAVLDGEGTPMPPLTAS